MSPTFDKGGVMALYYDLQVYKDVYRLTLLLFQYTKDFPKEYKYSLGKDIRRDSIILVWSIYRANKVFDKTPALDAIIYDFTALKAFASYWLKVETWIKNFVFVFSEKYR